MKMRIYENGQQMTYHGRLSSALLSARLSKKVAESTVSR